MPSIIIHYDKSKCVLRGHEEPNHTIDPLTFCGNMIKLAVQKIAMINKADTKPISGPAKHIINTNSTGHRPLNVISMNAAFFSWNAPLSNIMS